MQGDIGLALHHLGDRGAEGVPVHGQRAARCHAGGLGGLEQMAAQQLHLGLEQTGRGVQPVGLQAVGADQLGKALAFVGGAEFDRLLLVQVHLYALLGQPEGGLAARKARP